MPGLNILHINGEKNWSGGEGQIFNLCKELRRRGHNCFLASPQDSILIRTAAKDNFSVLPLRLNWFFYFINIVRVVRFIDKRKIDLVHAHSYNVYYLSALVAKIFRKKTLVLTRRMDFPLSNNIGNKVFFNRIVDKIAVISEAVRQSVLVSGVNPSKIEIIYSGIDLKEFDFRLGFKNDYTGSAEEAKIGTLAGLCERKGLKVLIEAARIVNQNFSTPARFFIAGTGPLKSRLEAYVKQLGLKDKVVFFGFKKNISDFLLNIDIFVLPSFQEALGVAVLEAMAMAKPVVATKVGGILESVQDGLTGFLVPPGDAGALAEKIIYLLKNPEAGKKMGVEGRRRVERKFNHEDMTLKYEDLYRSAHSLS